jgi:ribonuclease HII
MIENRLFQSGISSIAGVDEAGRGACAGPIVIAAVILKDINSADLREVKDSKELSPAKRESLFQLIINNSFAYSIIEIEAEEIDRKGLHKSNIEGMRRAVEALDIRPEYVLTDGYPIPGLAIPNLAVWKGDQVAISISAASILAKVHRDRVMSKLDGAFPGYGFATHKGYVTSSHQKAILKLGVTEIHRKSYANISELLHN